MADDELARIERWFVERGLPHFVERHDSAAEIWARALPLLVVAYLLLGLNALDLRELERRREPRRRRVRRRSAPSSRGSSPTGCAAAGWFERPRHIGAAELAVFIVVPGRPVARRRPVGRRRCRRSSTAVAILAVLWAITSYGVLAAARAGRGSGRWPSSPLLLNVVVRALPLLLLFTTFLFINAEVWQVAGTLTGVVYVAVLGIFFLLGAVFVLSRIPALMRDAQPVRLAGREVAELAGDTPAAGVLDELHAGADARRPPPSRPTMRQRLNIGLRHDLLAGDPDHARRARPSPASSSCSGSSPSPRRRRRRGPTLDRRRRARRRGTVGGRDARASPSR